MTKRWNFGWGTLRFRLIGWYVVLLVLTLVVFSVYFFFQYRDLQQAQQDTLLQGSADRLRGMVDPGRPGGGGTPDFRRGFEGGDGGPIQDLTRKNIQARLFDRNGKPVDSLGNSVSDMPQLDPVANAGAAVTVSSASSGQWRIYTQVVPFPGNGAGYVQVGQPVLVLNTEFSRLLTPILVGALLALLLAVLGGLFLANRALSPIDRVTRTAQSISTRDLSRRINYRGPADEIGRLAKTLDQMLERLEKGFEQERRFTSDASHELRTPLTALKGRIEVTLSRARSAKEYQETLEDLNQAVDRLVRLTNSLLYLARLDQAGHRWQSETLNLSDLLDSIVDSMGPVAELKQIKLECDIPVSGQAQGNLDQLTRLFLNLVDNALKYTPEGGKVTVRLYKVEKTKKVAVEVSDSGPGIAAEHLPHLFERFYRAQSDRASSSGGAGLGLAIANEIARQHGGTLEVESAVGQGTTLRVELPLAEARK